MLNPRNAKGVFIFCILNFIFFFYANAEYNLSHKLTKIYGPGLNPDKLVFPARYFFIEAYGLDGQRINSSLQSEFKVQVEGERTYGTYCRVWAQVLNRYDGTYIVRYRTYQTCTDLSINVLYDGQHVAESPYKFQVPIYSEDCYCPLRNLSMWTSSLKCPTHYEQIEEDLTPFQKVDMDLVLEEALRRHNQPHSKSFCNYVIKDNKVYRHCFGKYVGFNMFIDSILHSMLRKSRLPDVEFLVNLGDWPLVDKAMNPLIPIFSWCGSDSTADIILPTYEVTDSTLEMMGRIMVDVLSVQSNNAIPWSEKSSLAFFRGRDSRQERLDLVSLSREHPDLFNVSLTNFFFFKDQEIEYGPKGKHESFFKFFDNKYQISIDGTVAAYRFPYLLAGSGVVFKQDSPYYEHFYRGLKPNKHYIPFKRDLSDLVEKVKWAKENDEEVRQIGLEGRKFVLENLLPEHIYCYHIRLLQEWERRLVNPVKVRDGMEEIPILNQEKRHGECNCDRLNIHDEL